MTCPVVELRQYTLHPGRRDDLIELFDREFVETQEQTGMAVLGQFRDVRRPDRFVWLRGFPSMPDRAKSLAAFYGGPVWEAHRDEANATMATFDDVLLLRPVPPGTGLPLAGSRTDEAPASRILATLHFADEPFQEFPQPDLPPLACFTTEYAQNTFPALPVREGEHVFVWFARFDNQAAAEDYLATRAGSEPFLLLAPTARSLLR